MKHKISFSVLKEMYINLHNRHNVEMVLNNKDNREYYINDLKHDCALTDDILDNTVSHLAINQLKY